MSRAGAWVGTSGIGLFKYNYRDDNFEQYLTDRMGRSLIDKTIISICFQKENAIWEYMKEIC